MALPTLPQLYLQGVNGCFEAFLGPCVPCMTVASYGKLCLSLSRQVQQPACPVAYMGCDDMAVPMRQPIVLAVQSAELHRSFQWEPAVYSVAVELTKSENAGQPCLGSGSEHEIHLLFKDHARPGRAERNSQQKRF